MIQCHSPQGRRRSTAHVLAESSPSHHTLILSIHCNFLGPTLLFPHILPSNVRHTKLPGLRLQCPYFFMFLHLIEFWRPASTTPTILRTNSLGITVYGEPKHHRSWRPQHGSHLSVNHTLHKHASYSSRFRLTENLAQDCCSWGLKPWIHLVATSCSSVTS